MVIPRTLYRGISVPGEDLSLELLRQPLKPGSRVALPDGTLTVHDGNEWGVYTSDSQQAATVYAKPRNNTLVEGVPEFNWRQDRRARLMNPSAGVLFEIDPSGTQFRKPMITDYLQGHYNNGFAGDEWITDEIHPNRHRVAAVKISGSPVTAPQSWKTQDAWEAHELYVQAYKQHLGKIASFGEALKDMPEAHRLNHFKIQKLADEIRNS